MEDLEQQCEDALFELCDARERYPQRCADELEKSIKLNNEIQMMKVSARSTKPLDFPTITEEQNSLLNSDLNKQKVSLNSLDQKMDSIINKYENLKAVADQIKREKVFEMNRLLDS